MATSFTQPTKTSPTYSSPKPQPRYSPPTPVPSYSPAPAPTYSAPELIYEAPATKSESTQTSYSTPAPESSSSAAPSYSSSALPFSSTVPALSYKPTAPSPSVLPPSQNHSFSTHSPTYSDSVAATAPTQYSLPVPASGFSPPAEDLTLLSSVYTADPAEDEYTSHQTNDDKNKATGFFGKPPDILFNAEYEWGQRLNRWVGSER